MVGKSLVVLLALVSALLVGASHAPVGAELLQRRAAAQAEAIAGLRRRQSKPDVPIIIPVPGACLDICGPVNSNILDSCPTDRCCTNSAMSALHRCYVCKSSADNNPAFYDDVQRWLDGLAAWCNASGAPVTALFLPGKEPQTPAPPTTPNPPAGGGGGNGTPNPPPTTPATTPGAPTNPSTPTTPNASTPTTPPGSASSGSQEAGAPQQTRTDIPVNPGPVTDPGTFGGASPNPTTGANQNQNTQNNGAPASRFGGGLVVSLSAILATVYSL